jgi:hypothetical protein
MDTIAGIVLVGVATIIFVFIGTIMPGTRRKNTYGVNEYDILAQVTRF